ncbi:Hypothetical protein CAP_5113 [Chondromyces apiculatus DSM 436]|uniref:Uncharacterized protein n=1 Tax=Chondromyces apiculatus DSM 436 TaxID=1192034 RepID=A0A017T3L4_9BACT|nr:Hypothetical protein CAP_5113 [Chondromyces apiculatus DSM 436]
MAGVTLAVGALVLGVEWRPSGTPEGAVEAAAVGDRQEMVTAPGALPSWAMTPRPYGSRVEEAQAGARQGDPRRAAISTVREAARQYRVGRQNIFFDEAAFLAAMPEVDARYLSTLQEELERASELAALPASTRFMGDRPEVVLERMAMIDLLAGLAEHEQGATDALVALLVAPIDGALPEVAKKALVGERYDMLVALVQVDREAAMEAFSRIEHRELRRLLRPALLKGLYEEGLSVEAADEMTAHL